MTVTGVPLYLGGGEAQHSAELLRMQCFFAFRGQEGWLTSTSGQCKTFDTPGVGIQLMPGPFLINSRFSGGAMQSYMGNIISAEPCSATNVPPGSTRHDLVVMNIEDPYVDDGATWPYPGGQGTSARQQGPYIHVRIIENVPANTKCLADLPAGRPERNYTAICAARLDRPANTGTITQDMIVPLNCVINPWAGIQLPPEILNNLADLDSAVSDIGEIIEGIVNQSLPAPREYFDVYQCTPSGANSLTPGTAFKKFPLEAQDKVLIPPWATHMRVRCELIDCDASTGTVANDASCWGYMALQMGHKQFDTQYFRKTASQTEQVDLTYAGNYSIDSRDIGKVVNWAFYMQMDPAGAGHNGSLLPQVWTRFVIQFEFSEQAHGV